MCLIVGLHCRVLLLLHLLLKVRLTWRDNKTSLLQRRKADMEHNKFRRHKPQWQGEYGQLQDKAGYSGEISFFSTGTAAGWGIKLRLYTIHECIENSSFH